MITKTVLIVAYYFAPIAASGSMRPLGFCRYLGGYGWRPHVLTTEPKSVHPPVGVDESLSKQMPSDIRVVRVPHQNPEQTLLRLRNNFRARFRGLHLFGNSQRSLVAEGRVPEGGKDNASPRPFGFKDLLLERIFGFPDPQCSWLRPAVRRFCRLAGAKKPDVVFATGGPWTALLVGKALAKRFKVPFVADLRDPWTDNPYMKDRSRSILQKAKRAERSIYESAARVIANTPELCDKLRTDHADLRGKFLTITNGFDGAPGLPSTDPCGDRESGSSCFGQRDSIELCHFGTVYGNRSPIALLRALKELADNKQIAPDQLRIRFVGVWEVTDPSCEKLARDLEQRGMIRREPPVAHDDCVQLMRKAKVLLLLQPAYPLQIPGKIYEYIATGRPLLVIGGEGATANLVKKNQLGICCPNQVADIKTMLSRFVRRQLQFAPRRKEMQECFEYRALAGKLASVLDDVCAKPSQ